jgi:uracil-DNA glycosylase
MDEVGTLIRRSRVHDDWRPLLIDALSTLDSGYLHALITDDSWLPGIDRLLAAFRRDRGGVRYLLIGESPYPRAESANGIAFYDAAVGSLWSEQGLSKAVNRATSLRNIVKTALLAEGHVRRDSEGRISQQAIAAIDRGGLVGTLGELFDNLQQAGFLLLNATPVLHPQRKPAREARYWQAFLERLLLLIAAQAPAQVTLLLWGKIANLIEAMPASSNYRKLACEHPYNVSFIDNPEMLGLFAELSILQTASPAARQKR